LIIDKVEVALVKFLKQYPAAWIFALVAVLLYFAVIQQPGHQPAAPDVPAAASYCNYPTANQVGSALEAASTGSATQVPNPGDFTWTCNGLEWKWRQGIGFLPYPSAAHQWCRFRNAQSEVEYHTSGRDCASSHLLLKTETPPDQGMTVAWYDLPTKTWFEYGGSNVILGNTGCTAAGPWLSIYVGTPPGQHGPFFSKNSRKCGHIPSYSQVVSAINRFNRAEPPGAGLTATAPVCRATFNKSACDTTIN
jgi:hypothetical protein